MYFIYGQEVLNNYPLVTDMYPASKFPIILIDIIWIINVIVTYPLVLHPANMVLESYLFKGMTKSKKRTWLKNISRTILVGFTVVLSISLMDTLDKLESVNGAFACIPLAFTLPTLFHYKLVAETKQAKTIDLCIIVLGIVLQIVCTIVTFIYWNE